MYTYMYMSGKKKWKLNTVHQKTALLKVKATNATFWCFFQFYEHVSRKYNYSQKYQKCQLATFLYGNLFITIDPFTSRHRSPLKKYPYCCTYRTFLAEKIQVDYTILLTKNSLSLSVFVFA